MPQAYRFTARWVLAHLYQHSGGGRSGVSVICVAGDVCLVHCFQVAGRVLRILSSLGKCLFTLVTYPGVGWIGRTVMQDCNKAAKQLW
jgi:hypothetical protein